MDVMTELLLSISVLAIWLSVRSLEKTCERQKELQERLERLLNDKERERNSEGNAELHLHQDDVKWGL